VGGRWAESVESAEPCGWCRISRPSIPPSETGGNHSQVGFGKKSAEYGMVRGLLKRTTGCGFVRVKTLARIAKRTTG